jgi:dTDP-4-amino-4,6-dideoxygalactose transaminase
MSDISAVYILQFLMNNFDKIVSHHNDLYKYVNEKLKKIKEQESSELKWKLFPSFHYNDIIVPSCLSILFDNYDDNIRLKLLENDIYCRKYYYPLKNTKVACEIFNSILCITFTTETTKEDIDNIFEILCTC